MAIHRSTENLISEIEAEYLSSMKRDFQECATKAKAALSQGDRKMYDFWREEAAIVRDSIKHFHWRLNNN